MTVVDGPRNDTSAVEMPMLGEKLVAVCRCTEVQYPVKPPFDPPEIFPEFSARVERPDTDPTNEVFASVRESFRLLMLDITNYGTELWNPLGHIIFPGDHVLIKPNWVRQGHHLNDSWEQIITHGAVIRAVIDYVSLALGGRGRISLADGPMLSSDFGQIVAKSGVRKIKEQFERCLSGIELELLDLRDTYLETRDDVVVGKHQLSGDPRGSVDVDLARSSLFHGFRGEGRYYGAEYDTEEVNRHHSGEVQEYRLSGTAVGADAIIDVPKLKTHQKVGVTLALKGVVGLNCGRNWLPHRTQGTPDQGGDQFAESGWRQKVESAIVTRFEEASLRYPKSAPALYRLAKRVGKSIFGTTDRTVRGGGWHGNDTIWRMVLDINRALTYADSTGAVRAQPTKRRFSIIDGIVAGEGNGPVYADAKACGLIIAGGNPVAVDIVATIAMGFDYKSIPMLAEATSPHRLPLVNYDPSSIEVTSNVAEWNGGPDVLGGSSPFDFVAPVGWVGKIERNSSGVPSTGE